MNLGVGSIYYFSFLGFSSAGQPDNFVSDYFLSVKPSKLEITSN